MALFPTSFGALSRPVLSAPTTLRALLPSCVRTFTATPAPQKKKKSAAAGSEYRARLAVIRGNLHGFAPPPLRMARNRYLRHWTIHRAWQLHQRKLRESHERELMRQYQGMHNACEELRNTSGPGLNGEGYLYRVAMEKKGMYGLKAVPIEYARLQTETPAKMAWDHDWKR